MPSDAASDCEVRSEGSVPLYGGYVHVSELDWTGAVRGMCGNLLTREGGNCARPCEGGNCTRSVHIPIAYVVMHILVHVQRTIHLSFCEMFRGMESTGVVQNGVLSTIS